MKVAALLTSAGINIGVCVLLFSLYSILRKQPSNVSVYFGRRLAVITEKRKQGFGIERLVPSASWIMKAWDLSEAELLSVGGLDAVVFCRALVFSIQIFSIAAALCLFFVLPVNYYGKEMNHKWIASESLDVFTIANVEEGSKWLWVHCLALYIITMSACVLLYFNYKSITSMRLAHITGSPPNPSHFAVLVRSIPWSAQESYSDSVKKFFSKYHAAGYLSHQMVYKCGTVHKLMTDAEEIYKSISDTSCGPIFMRCGFCGSSKHSFKMLTEQVDSVVSGITDFSDSSIATRDQECAAAFVFFKTRFDAVVGSHLLQSTNPMFWVTDLAPEPHDVFWSNLWIPYRQLWLRQIATVLAAVVFVFAFLVPVTFVQGLTQLDQLQQTFPSLREPLKSKALSQLITGYLPSVILMLFLYTVPPIMMLFSAAEGCISHSGRKKSACCKVLYFTIWNVFFVNVLSGSVINQVVERPKEILSKLAEAVPMQATFFMTYALTSGWASLSCEIMQICPLLFNWFYRLFLRYEQNASDCCFTFPYHTEVPRVLLFGLIAFTCAIMAPLILPFVLIYYILAYFVYKNQFANVYTTKYESGGRFWPIIYNTTIFSLVLSQVTAIGVFGLRKSPVAAGFTFPLVIGTLLFYEYCRRRFKPIFTSNTAVEVLIEMDLRDEQSGKLKAIYEELHAAYCQLTLTTPTSDINEGSFNPHLKLRDDSKKRPASTKKGKEPGRADDAWSICCNVGEQK